MSHNSRKQLRNWGIIGGLVLLGITSYTMYNNFIKRSELDENPTKKKKYTSKPITIILTDSIISSNLPLNEILSKTDDIVLVVSPGLTVDDLNEKLNDDIKHKVIECDTFQGIWSVVKHLQSEIIFVVEDDLEQEIPKGLERYVGEIVVLNQNFAVINETILSFIMS